MRQIYLHIRLYDAADLGIAEFAFCLAFKLRIGDFYADNGGQSLAQILALDFDLLVFQQLLLRDIAV